MSNVDMPSLNLKSSRRQSRDTIYRLTKSKIHNFHEPKLISSNAVNVKSFPKVFNTLSEGRERYTIRRIVRRIKFHSF